MVMNLVNIEQHNARALLMHHRWKMDRIHDFLERRGREGLFREAGIVVPPEDSSAATRARAPHKRPRTFTCNVCFEDVSRMSDVSTMDCGHCFCNDCEYPPQFLLPPINCFRAVTLLNWNLHLVGFSIICDFLVMKIIEERKLRLVYRLS